MASSIQMWISLYPLLFLTAFPLYGRSSSFPSSSCGPGRSWAVRLNSGSVKGELFDRLAQTVADDVGLENHGQIGQLEGHYLLCQGPGDSEDMDSRSTEAALDKNAHVVWHSQEHILRRSKRSVTFNDPKYPIQWHLHNDEKHGMDINVTGVWERNITGVGVTVVVVDDGVQHNLVDIQPNYSPEGSYDLNSNDPDPMPHPDGHSDNHHGTRCAGEIAAVSNNGFCAVGVAYGGKVAGIRVLDGPLTDSMEAVAFNKHYQINDIYSCSWGPDDDGRTVDGPHPLGKAALQHGVIAGRKGFGSIFVVASGNGGQYEDDCNYDGYANSIYTVTIGAVDENGRKPFYAEECASMLAVTFSSGSRPLRSIVTSDWSLQSGTGCTSEHTGTSAAAPLAAGMVALMLQVRPCLSWRDVQHIITYTAVQHGTQADWKTNGAGFNHSHKFGFGLLNAWRLVNAAKVWEFVPFLVSYQSPVLKVNDVIPGYRENLTVTWNVTAFDLQQSGMQTLEHVSVTVTISHPRRGNVEMVLICPSGMTSLIGARRALDVDTTGFTDWTLSTVRCWGEKAEGQYRLNITDHNPALSLGTLNSWKLTLYGSSMSHQQVKERRRIVEEAMGGQYLNSSFALPCPPGIDVPPEIVSPFTSNSLKSLLLLGCFALFWSLYYTLEVTLTHVDWRRCRTAVRNRNRGLQAGSSVLDNSEVVEIQPEIDMESKVPLISGDENT
ncbi:proprotein convertase subtilisin/kexin type 7 isoform X2 [Misgurnus anguillicaudatus]|uniref:proprotein convertase subtilisin/kexin type 7 isoform X2 n=1 Tax=Misgurnus anguillicaudatus TaxID=75329 RepID=UPI002435A711|nr:proprotein convertase subtilisin/kexin type 7-like isoform X2 [Misgurnus anguillicaudatus]